MLSCLVARHLAPVIYLLFSRKLNLLNLYYTGHKHVANDNFIVPFILCVGNTNYWVTHYWPVVILFLFSLFFYYSMSALFISPSMV